MKKSQETTVTSGGYIDVRVNSGKSNEICSFVLLTVLMSIFFWIAVATAICTMNWIPLIGFAKIFPIATVVVIPAILLMRLMATEENLRLGVNRFQSNTINAEGEAVFSTPVLHAQIASIQWPLSSRDEKLLVEVKLKDFVPEEVNHDTAHDRKEKDGASTLMFAKNSETLNLRHFSPSDRRLLVRYLSKIDVPQIHWNEFCYRYAQKWSRHSKRYLGNSWLANQYESAPFLTAALLGPLLMLRASMAASVYLFWLMGVALLISTIVNVRLFHGSWVPPIGPWLLIGGVGLVLFGCVTYWFQTNIESSESLDRWLRRG